MCLLKFILHLITSWVSLTVMAPRHSCHANPGNNPWISCCPGDCGKSWNAKHMRRHRPAATAIWSFYSKILILGLKFSGLESELFAKCKYLHRKLICILNAAFTFPAFSLCFFLSSFIFFLNAFLHFFVTLYFSLLARTQNSVLLFWGFTLSNLMTHCCRFLLFLIMWGVLHTFD